MSLSDIQGFHFLEDHFQLFAEPCYFSVFLIQLEIQFLFFLFKLLTNFVNLQATCSFQSLPHFSQTTLLQGLLVLLCKLLNFLFQITNLQSSFYFVNHFRLAILHLRRAHIAIVGSIDLTEAILFVFSYLLKGLVCILVCNYNPILGKYSIRCMAVFYIRISPLFEKQNEIFGIDPRVLC